MHAAQQEAEERLPLAAAVVVLSPPYALPVRFFLGLGGLLIKRFKT